MKKNGRKAIWMATTWMVGFLMLSPLTWGGQVTNEVQKSIDRIISILTDPKYKGPEKKTERRALIRQMANERFNWEEMARRSLGPHWRDRSEAERKEFISLFGNLLERTYIDKIESYSGEKVIYAGESVDGEYSTANTKVLTKNGTEVPLDYRLMKVNGQWKVYDIVVAGVSLVNNYRSQFNSILVRSSFKDLLEKLKAKQAG